MKFIHEFIEYKNGEVKDNGWWRIEGDKVVNMVGGWHHLCIDDKSVIVEANDWHDLDWSCLIKPDSPYGWVDIQGNFFGCDYMEHAFFAKYYFKLTERTLEDIGYVKIYREIDGSQAYYVSRHLNEKQENKLLELGVEL